MLDPAEMPGRLAAFLSLQEPGVDRVEVTSYEVMTGGYSRLLARADAVFTRQGVREERVFVLRGDPPPDRQLLDTSRDAEHEVLSVVGERVPVANARYFDPTGEHLMTPTLVLDFIPSPSLLAHVGSGGDASALVDPLADVAAAIHAIPVDELPARLERPESWDSYMTVRIDEWRRAARAHVESLPILRYVAAWLDDHRPEPVDLTLIHGDFQSANLLVASDGGLVVLDWELAQIGDPREDLGYFKALAQAAGPDVMALDEERFCSRYRELLGLTETQLNPAVVSYFVVLGVIGTVRRLLEGGAAYSRGEHAGLPSLFAMNSLLFGQSVWLSVTEQLEQVLGAVGATPEGKR